MTICLPVRSLAFDIGRWSLVVGRWSFVVRRSSFVVGRSSFVDPESYVRNRNQDTPGRDGGRDGRAALPGAEEAAVLPARGGAAADRRGRVLLPQGERRPRL